MAFEACTGARVGEVFSAQVAHGVPANNLVILKWEGASPLAGGAGAYRAPEGVQLGDEFVEATTESSKTKFGRSFSVVGTTKGPARVPLAALLRKYWQAAGMVIEEYVEGGWRIEAPDFWVVQIPLLGVIPNDGKMNKIRSWFNSSQAGQVRQKAQALSIELNRLARIKDPKQKGMFLNVAGGPKDGPGIARAMSELKEMGVGCVLTPGPLMMKTVGKELKVTGLTDSRLLPMPLLAGSTYQFLHRATDAAYAKLQAKDPEYRINAGSGREQPHFAHNTWRRMADSAAQATFARKECSKEDVDLQFGWKLKELSRTMRLHYADRGARASRARITEWI